MISKLNIAKAYCRKLLYNKNIDIFGKIENISKDEQHVMNKRAILNLILL